MRGCFGAGSTLNALSDVGLAFSIRPGPCTILATIAAIGSFAAILIGISTNPRGVPHVTACVTWAFLRIVWGTLLLRVLWAPRPGAMLRTLFGAALACLGVRLAVTAHSGDMPGHLEVLAVVWMLFFELTLLPEAAGYGADDASSTRVVELPHYSGT